MEACCTCATVLNPPNDEKPEKAYRGPSVGRRLPCCPRMMCGDCLHENPRFETYCPYCQVSSEPSLLPQGLRAPPSYTAKPVSSRDSGLPPPYSKSNEDVNPQSVSGASSTEYNEKEPVDDTLHFLNHDHDSITSLSLRYGVPAAALRQKNNIASDHLLLGRKTILIPGDYYRGGVSLSPRPVEGENEELRKQKIRRFMTTSKVADYDIALLYLEQAGYNLDTAVEAHFADEEWERKHPRESSRKRRIGQGSFLRRN